MKFNYHFLKDELPNVPSLDILVYSGSQLPKNYRVAFSMMKEKPIINNDWIEDSLKENRLGEIENYKLKYQISIRKGNL